MTLERKKGKFSTPTLPSFLSCKKNYKAYYWDFLFHTELINTEMVFTLLRNRLYHVNRRKATFTLGLSAAHLQHCGLEAQYSKHPGLFLSYHNLTVIRNDLLLTH